MATLCALVKVSVDDYRHDPNRNILGTWARRCRQDVAHHIQPYTGSILSLADAVIGAANDNQSAGGLEYLALVEARRILFGSADELVAAHDQAVDDERAGMKPRMSLGAALAASQGNRLDGTLRSLLRSVDAVANQRKETLRRLRDALDRRDIGAVMAAAVQLVGRE